LLALALVATAAVLARVTSAPARVIMTGDIACKKIPASTLNSVPFHLTLSAPAAELEMDTGKIVTLPVTDSSISGTLEIDPENPRINLRIRWKSPAAPSEHRFAKLVLEPPHRTTLTHIFDAAGDIDDFLELPLSFAK
jgi:hypothetical protein